MHVIHTNDPRGCRNNRRLARSASFSHTVHVPWPGATPRAVPVGRWWSLSPWHCRSITFVEGRTRRHAARPHTPCTPVHTYTFADSHASTFLCHEECEFHGGRGGRGNACENHRRCISKRTRVLCAREGPRRSYHSQLARCAARDIRSRYSEAWKAPGDSAPAPELRSKLKRQPHASPPDGRFVRIIGNILISALLSSPLNMMQLLLRSPQTSAF